MKDIKNLYLNAKNSRKEIDISAYKESVNELFENSPSDYISNLEYIIKSDIGLSTFKEFVDKYGLPIAAFENVMNIVDECIHKGTVNEINVSKYEECKTWLESYRNKYIKCFAMYEYYADSVPSDYIKTYYGRHSSGKQNRELLSGMYKKFNECAIPDLLITTEQLGAGNIIKKYFEEVLVDPMICEWTVYASTNTGINLQSLYERTHSAVVENMRDRNTQVYRESVVMGNNDAVYEYSDEEIDSIKALINFKEYCMTWSDEIHESVSSDIYSLYEELDGVIFEEDDRVGEKKKISKEDLVPIFGIAKCYTDGNTRNDGTEKGQGEKNSIFIKKGINFMMRGDLYSHAVVSFNDEMTNMYSFDSRGFVEENINEDSWMSTESIYVTVMFVTKEEKEKMKKFCKDLLDEQGSSKYAYLNLIRAFAGKPVKQNKRHICSTFVAYILQCSNPKNLHRDYSRLRPEDITILPRAFYVMNLRDRMDFRKRKSEFDKRVKEIFDEHYDEILEYNNDLPKLLLKEKMDSLRTLDKLLDWISNRGKGDNKDE